MTVASCMDDHCGKEKLYDLWEVLLRLLLP